jgi:RNA polymerase sigma factor (sigma-70 family)
MSTTLHQEELLRKYWEQVLEGDTRAYAQLHELLHPVLYRYAGAMLNDEELAADVIQELFIKLWFRKEKIGPLDHVRAFFFTALRRQALNQLRSLRSLQIILPASPDIVFSPEDVLIEEEHTKQRQDKIRQHLASLPKRQREVIYLRYYEELNYQEIAAVMDINYQSVLNLAHKGILQLRSLMGYLSILILLLLVLVSLTVETVAQRITDMPVYPLPAISAGGDDAGWKQVFDDKITDSIKIVGLGEVSHGAHEPLQLKSNVIQYLVTVKHFRVLLMEYPNFYLMPISHYLMDSNVTDLNEAPVVVTRAFSGNIINTQEVVDLVRWLKTYNISHPTDMVSLKGIDVIGSPTSFLNYFLDTYLTPYDIFTAMYLREKWNGREEQMKLEDISHWMEQGAERLQRKMPAQEYEELLYNLHIARSTVLFSSQQKQNIYRAAYYRDSVMAANAGQLAIPKAIIWAHNVHIDTEPRAVTLGNMLHQQYGDKCYTILTDYSNDAMVRVINPRATSANDFFVLQQVASDKKTAAATLRRKYGINKGILFYNDLKRSKLPTLINSIDREGSNTLIGMGKAFDALLFLEDLHPNHTL